MPVGGPPPLEHLSIPLSHDGHQPHSPHSRGTSPTVDTLVQFPSREEQDPEIAEQVRKGLFARRTRTPTPWKRKCKVTVETLGRPKKADGGSASSSSSSDSEEDEVGDDWFGHKDEDGTKGFVRLSIGKVPRKAKTVLRRKFMGRYGKRPSVLAECENGNDRFACELDEVDYEEGGAALGTEASTSTYSSGPLQHSPAASVDSLVTLDLPFLTTTGSFSSVSSNVSRAQTPYSRTSFPALSTLPTLSEIRTFSSTSSSDAGTSATSPQSGYNTPSRTLSIDDSAINGVKRSLSKSTFKSGKYQRMHLPGRPKFMEKKKHKHRGADRSAAEAVAFDEAVAQALRLAGVLADEEEKVEVDVLIEHQRGLVVFGLPKFSSAALLQPDPPEWTDVKLQATPFTLHDHPCPPYWHWRDSEFMVDMSGDKDEEGWSYAVRFRSRFWRGEAVFPHAFVRRRRWVRTRIYRPQALPSLGLAHSTSTPGGGFHTGDTSSSAFDLADEALECAGTGAEREEDEIVCDLRSACRVLPLSTERKALIFAESASAGSAAAAARIGRDATPATATVDPRNPFLSYRRLKMETWSMAGPGSNDKDALWREAVIEINCRRVVGILKVYATIDRKRLELWKLWMRGKDREEGGGGTVKRSNGKGKGKGFGGIEEDEEGEPGRPEVSDVWDLIEARLDLLLSTFDYHTSRQSFLRLVLSLHPLKATPHRRTGYDAPPSKQVERLEGNLSERVEFYEGVQELVKSYGCAEGLETEASGEGRAEDTVREKEKETLKGSRTGSRTLARLRIAA